MSRTACYLVRRLAWDSDYSAVMDPSQSWQGGSGGTGPRYVAVATFLTEREAKTDAHRRNVEARAGRSPFWFSHHLDELTTHTFADARSRLARKGLATPPAVHPEDSTNDPWRTFESWREWWDCESANWTAEQLADVWAVFDRLQFYDVVEIEMED